MESRPPELADSIIRALTPRDAREEILGDLWERYRSPASYLFEAAQILPFVIAAQMRRNTNFAALGIVAIGVFGMLGGFVTDAPANEIPRWARAALPTAMVVFGFVLRDVYGTKDERALCAALGDVAAVALLLVASQAVLSFLTLAAGFSEDWLLSARHLPMAPSILFCVFLFRYALNAGRDRELEAAEGAMSEAQLRANFSRFRSRVGWRNLGEICAGFGLLAVAAFTLPNVEYRVWIAALPWAAGHIAFVAYLVFRGAAREHISDPGFSSLRLHYRAELERQRALRRYVWWWYTLPLFVGIGMRTIAPGIAEGNMQSVLAGICAVLFLAFVLWRLTQERSRRFQNSIDLVSAIREGVPKTERG